MSDNTYKLLNGVSIPEIGFGTFRMEDEGASEAVATAIGEGYRLIDTASCYGNEVGVGEGIRGSGINRQDIFLASKVWNDMRGYDNTLKAFDETMERLNMDYLDMYMIHWPASFHRFDDWEEINVSTWKALIELYKQKRVRTIGVCNFKEHHLRALMETEIQPMVNQIVIHPGFSQVETVDYCQNNGIIVEAWAPLGKGEVLATPDILKLADKYQRTPAQICLRWDIQRHIVPIPKTQTKYRMAENISVFDFELSDDDMRLITDLPFCGGPSNDPDKVDY